MLYISVQPDIPYFHWQVEVMLQNFKDKQVDLSQCRVIFLYNSISWSQEVRELEAKFNEVKFFFYQDDRDDKSYIPSIKPYGMYKYCLENPINDQVFYHDCDIVFHTKINESLFKDKKIWYMSDTISYIGYEYCSSKGLDQLEKMTSIVNIPIDIVKANQQSSGGAQYIMFQPSSHYWHKVYRDSNSLYKFLNSQPQVVKEGEYPIQKWCAEMWATLWNIWYFNCETQVHSELDFCFATNPIKDLESKKILHNAGVTAEEKHRLFFKGAFINNNPTNLTELELNYVDPNSCSWYYKEAVRRVAELNK